MLVYNLRLSFKSLKRNPVLTLLLITGVALGISVSTTFMTTHHVLGKDPLPHKSDRLFYVRMDSWDPGRPYPGEDSTQPPSQLTYRDTVEVLRSDIPLRQAAMYEQLFLVRPEEGGPPAYREPVRVTTGDFFTMFEVPFQFGSGWDRDAEARLEPVAVIDRATNDKLFGGENSVGRTIQLGDREFQIVGVIADWYLPVKFYDLTRSSIDVAEAIYIPFDLTRSMEIRGTGNHDGWGESGQPGYEGFLSSETCWVQLWVELEDSGTRLDYEQFLAAYVAEQKKIGRFQRPLNNRVNSVTEWMKDQDVVPESATTLAVAYRSPFATGTSDLSVTPLTTTVGRRWGRPPVLSRSPQSNRHGL